QPQVRSVHGMAQPVPGTAAAARLAATAMPAAEADWSGRGSDSLDGPRRKCTLCGNWRSPPTTRVPLKKAVGTSEREMAGGAALVWSLAGAAVGTVAGLLTAVVAFAAYLCVDMPIGTTQVDDWIYASLFATCLLGPNFLGIAAVVGLAGGMIGSHVR